MRIVFLIRHALYLRNFESVVRALAERDHEIFLVFSPMPRPVDAALLTALTQEYRNVVEHPIAPRTGWWWPVSDGIRVFRDYLRYLAPEYRGTPALVERGGSRLPASLRWLFDHVPGLQSRPVLNILNRALTLLDRALVPDPGVLAALRQWGPDLLLVTPMIDFTYGQTEYVKAARSLGIPAVLAVASWDNLTNKGVIQICPDRVLVWNARQEREAVEMHGIPSERLRKTGAQLYDHWFEMSPSLDRAAFCSRVCDLDPSKPIILYICSSLFICKNEVSFVREWLAQLRQASDPALRDANVIVRPHPQHGEQWRGVNLASLGPAVIWPPEGGAPLDDERKRDYFDSLYHAGVVVGINTSGFIEAGIVGKRTLTIATEHFRATQEGTLHFHYLTEGGLLQTGRSFDEHLSQLARALAAPADAEKQVRAFIADFVRPAGMEKPATPVVVEEIEQSRSTKPQSWIVPTYAPLIRAVLWPFSIPVRRAVLAATSQGMHRGIERTRFPRFLPPDVGSPRLPRRFHGKENASLSRHAYKALARIANSDRPIIIGPWLGSIGDELLHWIPMLRWAQQTYDLDPKRFVVVSRGGVESWYGELAHRYVDFFDLFAPGDLPKFKAGAAQCPPKYPQQTLQVAEVESRLLRAAQEKLHLGDYDLLHPQMMFGALFYFHWTGRASPDYLRRHACYLPLPLPQPGEIEARLPEAYYAIRFSCSDRFPDSRANRQFVRQTIDKLLERGDVVLLDAPFADPDRDDITWMQAASNGQLHDNRLIHTSGWMTARNNLDVQSRILARSRCFAGTHGGLSYIAPFYGTPSIAFHQRREDLSERHVTTATALFGAFDVPFMLLTPDDAKLLNDAL